MRKAKPSEYPEIHKKRVRKFIKTRSLVEALGPPNKSSGIATALMELSDDVKNRIKRPTVKQFELDEADSGTAVALYNVIWEIAADILHDIGVKRIRTSTKQPK